MSRTAKAKDGTLAQYIAQFGVPLPLLCLYPAGIHLLFINPGDNAGSLPSMSTNSPLVRQANQANIIRSDESY